MKFKSLLLAAAMVGGIALGASAANAEDEYMVNTGSYAGTLDFDDGSPLPNLQAGVNTLWAASNGTGAYQGVTLFSISPVTGSVDLFYGSNNVNYTIDTSTAHLNAAETVLTVGNVAGGGVATIVSGAPEPGVWLLMIAGVAMIGSALRFNRKQGALAVA